MIQRIYIDNYKCFSDFTFEPKQINLLVGANGAGKSALFEVLAAVRALVVEGKEFGAIFGQRSLPRGSGYSAQKQTIRVEVQLPLGLILYELMVEEGSVWGATPLHETVSMDRELYRLSEGHVKLLPGSTGDEVRFPFRPVRSYLPSLEAREAHPALAEFLGWVKGLLIFDLRPEQMRADTEVASPTLDRSGANLSAWYRYFTEDLDPIYGEKRSQYKGGPGRKVLSEVEAELKQILGGFSGLFLNVHDLHGKAKRMEVWFNGSSGLRTIALDELSDGQRALVALYFILHAIARSQTGATLCFDEPDRHLNPREIQPWLFQLGEALRENGGQAFVISHHPEVIDYLAADHAWEFFLSESGVAQVRPLLVDRESGLTASQWLTLSPKP